MNRKRKKLSWRVLEIGVLRICGLVILMSSCRRCNRY